LKEAWHHVAIADAAKLAAQLMELKLPVAVAPVANKTKYVRKKQKKAVVKGPGRVNDYYNNHVPDAYRDDSWKETLSLDQQMYGKNG
jgi:ribose 5-phosphate isomerase